MSCDLIFNDKARGLIVAASSGSWAAMSNDGKVTKIVYPSIDAISGGVIDADIMIPFKTFLKYKRHCEKELIDADLTEENLPNVIRNYGYQTKIHNYDVLNHQ